jgi:hypothetical protein
MSTPAYPAGVWCADFEFHPEHGQDGNPLVPICLVIQGGHAGVIRRYWRDELIGMPQAPFPTTADALLVAYNASAEMACFAALNWPFPVNVLDLYAEFRNLTNGLPLPAGKGLLGALTYFGEPCMAASQKDVMRDLILSAGPWTADERTAISAYCEADVVALVRLYRRPDRLAACLAARSVRGVCGGQRVAWRSPGPGRLGDAVRAEPAYSPAVDCRSRRGLRRLYRGQLSRSAVC